MTQAQYTHDTDVVLQTQTLSQEPSLYHIIMHDDDFTTMDFVVMVLMSVFDYEPQQAVDTMMQIHYEDGRPLQLSPKRLLR